MKIDEQINIADLMDQCMSANDNDLQMALTYLQDKPDAVEAIMREINVRTLLKRELDIVYYPISESRIKLNLQP